MTPSSSQSPHAASWGVDVVSPTGDGCHGYGQGCCCSRSAGTSRHFFLSFFFFLVLRAIFPELSVRCPLSLFSVSRRSDTRDSLLAISQTAPFMRSHYFFSCLTKLGSSCIHRLTILTCLPSILLIFYHSTRVIFNTCLKLCTLSIHPSIFFRLSGDSRLRRVFQASSSLAELSSPPWGDPETFPGQAGYVNY